ncbi:prolyl oligopeptidase [Catalinimonas alkaloidigena]|uniref:prolyl oligopeptidase n=2 Tax=Catalinimonas alkaloidigena TaxID=1075417 RepID=A0A1G8ZPF2_9BACT|nr:prolyl oligopeptidase [Catalinimonas alkaloidigena]
MAACQTEKQPTRTAVTYPETRRDTTVSTDYFGTQVGDPYRWLEDDTAAEVADWVERQNAVTFDYLKQIPFREQAQQRLTELWNYEKVSAPFRRGDRYFFFRNDGLQNQSVLYVQASLDAEPEVLLDPNNLSDDGTVALSNLEISKDGQQMAYALSRSGSDWQEIYVMDVASKEKRDDAVQWAKFTGIAWKDNGFYYSRYDAPTEGKEFSQTNQFHKVYYHKIGTPQANDQLVYEDPQHAQRTHGVYLTEDERFLILSSSEGTSGNSLYVRDLDKGQSGFTPMVTDFENDHSVVDAINGKLLVLTNYQAPNNRLVLVDPAQPTPDQWKDLVPESEAVLESASTVGGKLFLSYMEDAHTRVYQYATTGQREREIELPSIGTASGFGGRAEDKDLFYTFTSFTFPPTVYRYDLTTGESTLFRKPDVPFDPEQYETQQVFFNSKDGTRVPMFIVYRKGLERNGDNPALLYSYGGFNIALTPSFSPANLMWIDQGGVYALANLRGGSEYGEAWHKGGMLDKKQNVFDDFIGAAEYLIQEKYTSSGKLAIRGGSNGGLLIGAVMTQRPDLFQVAIPQVGVMDMLRYHKFTIGWAWGVEYGVADSSQAEFENLYRYSPLHNLKPGTEYPATLVTTADHDDRVVPAHSFKFISALQTAQAGEAPVLIRIETKAGHGAGKPTSKQIEEYADLWSFAWYNMGVDPFAKDSTEHIQLQ